MPTIVATPGSATANSFATEVQFIAYAAARLNVPSGTTVTGSACTETEKTALIDATRELSRMSWKGARVDAVQSLSWPRLYVTDPDNPLVADFGSTVIPVRVIEATIEYALEFVRAGTTDLAAADRKAGVIEETIDVLTTRWESAGQRATGLARFPRIVTLIATLLDPAGAGLRLVRT